MLINVDQYFAVIKNSSWNEEAGLILNSTDQLLWWTLIRYFIHRANNMAENVDSVENSGNGKG